MQTIADRPEAPIAIRTNLGAIFVSLELSRSTWLITSLAPDGGEKMSKHVVRGGDVAGLLERFAQLREKTRARTGKVFPFVVIQEAGLDGFWIDRALQNEGIESHVVDPASIATSRRRRRAKTDKIDGDALVRALLAYKRGEPRVCAMVKAPTPEEEDRRRLCRERKVLIAERVRHVNRVKGLLFSQGISGYEPLRRDRRERLDTLQTGDGRLLPDHLKAQVRRELDRLELLLKQIKAVEAERDALLAAQQVAAPAAMLLDIKGIGPEFAAILWSEGLFRHFDNRRQVASYAGLAPTPWQSGSVDREQGVSKAGNQRLRAALIQLAWLWLRHQPQSALALWFEERVRRNGGRLKKTTIVALARKLLAGQRLIGGESHCREEGWLRDQGRRRFNIGPCHAAGHCGLPTDQLVPLAEKLLEVPQEAIRTALDLELREGTVIADRVGETPCVFKAILRILAAKGTDLLLCVPTGRAAKRMTEATGFEAKTIHRLLESIPRAAASSAARITRSTATCWWSTRPLWSTSC